MSARKSFALSESVMKPAWRQQHEKFMEEPLAVTSVQKLPLSHTTENNRSLAPSVVFINMFGVRYNKLQPFCPHPLKISVGCSPVCGNG